MLEQALGEAYKSLGAAEEGACVLTWGEDWQPGIVGLIASRLKEMFGRPAFAIAFNGELGTGLGALDFRRRSGENRPGGGGARASGEGRRPRHGGGRDDSRENLDAFKAFLKSAMADEVAQARQNAGLLVDGLLTASACTRRRWSRKSKGGDSRRQSRAGFCLAGAQDRRRPAIWRRSFAGPRAVGRRREAGACGLPRRFGAVGSGLGQGRARGRISPVR